MPEELRIFIWLSLPITISFYLSQIFRKTIFYFKKKNPQIHLLFLHSLILLSISYLGNTICFLIESFSMRHLQLKLSNASGFSDHNNHYFSLPLTLRESRQKITVSRSTWLIVNFKLCSTSSNQWCLFRKAVKRNCFFGITPILD